MPQVEAIPESPRCDLLDLNFDLPPVQLGNAQEEIIRKVKKEDLKYTPVPVFDCAFCVRGQEFEILQE